MQNFILFVKKVKGNCNTIIKQEELLILFRLTETFPIKFTFSLYKNLNYNIIITCF